MTEETQRLESAIAALEAQRSLLGDAVLETALAPLRARLAALRAPPAIDQALKQVTVLFLDVVGSTALSQHLDPEETHAVMDGALARCTAIVVANQGRVLQYAGDNLLAVFGADEAQEDDAERAVRTGLALLDEGKRLGQDVLRAHGHAGFDVRVGIHTGGVLLGGGVDAEGSIRGIAVNIAARMEQTAPAGGLRISHATYRQVRGAFDVLPQPPIEVKGVDQPIASHLVLRAKPRAFRVATRGIEGIETQMIGRDSELALLQQAFERLCREGRLVAVTVVAEAGIGKSRLLYEFQNWAEARPEPFTVFQGRAHPSSRRQPYGLLRDILAARVAIEDGDSMEAAKRKLEAGLAPLFAADAGDDAAQAHAHLLGHLIGLDFGASPHVRGILEDGRQIRTRAFHAAALLLRKLAVRDAAPLVLLLDDLHWADDGSLDFLAHLAEVNRDVPMLMLALTRPALFEHRPEWPGLADAQRIDLQALARDAGRALAGELLKKLPEIPAALRELVTGGAEGNPFYMEELVKMLVDEGAIDTTGAQWRVVADKLLALRVPPTLTGVLQARLDGLLPAEKLALQEASVIGAVFWDEALAAIDAQANAALPGVTRRELVVPQPDTRLDGVREYAFKHQILHHVTYDTVLKRLRRVYHAKVAAWLAGRSGARANDFLAATAEHYEKAGQIAPACEFYARAAEHARARYAHQATLDHASHALALLGAPSVPEPADALRLRWRLLDVRERTLDLQGRRDEQRADIAALEALADALDDDRLRFEPAWRRADIAMRTADYRGMAARARAATVIAERTGDPTLRLRAQQRLAIAISEGGEIEAGKALAHEGLAHARVLGLRRLESLFLNVLAVAAGMQDDLLVGLAIDQQKLQIDRELGNRINESVCLCNLGVSWFDLGDFVQARQHFEQGLRMTREVGDRAMESMPLLSLSELALREGKAAEALAHARAALDSARAVQNPESEARALWAAADAELALGRHAEAATTFERAHAAATAADVPVQHDALAGVACTALLRDDRAAAMHAVERLLAHLAGGGGLSGCDSPRLIRLRCHQVLAACADPRAAAVLAEAHAELMERAATLTDAALRHGFLNNIPEHREIVAAAIGSNPAA